MKRVSLKSGVYQILNIEANKVYIGSSVNVLNRMKDHKKALMTNAHGNRHLQRAWNKYGAEAFIFERLERVPVARILEREQHWIDFYGAAVRKNGYNICPMAGNTLGFKPTKEQRKKISERNSGAGNPMYGKTHSAEARAALSAFHTGLKMPKEFREKMSIVTKGENNGMHGKRHTVEVKKTIAEKLKERGGYKGTNNPNFGNKWPEEKRRMMSKRIIETGCMNGDKNPNSKIKVSEHQKILDDVIAGGEEAINGLAKKYGVCSLTIKNILKKVGYYGRH